MISISQDSFKKKHNVSFLIISIIFILIFTIPNNSPNFFAKNYEENNLYDFDNPKLSSNGPISKPLLITQHSTISNTIFPSSLPKNISFTLLEDWTSQNVTINYNEVSHQKDWVINGSFEQGEDPWEYDSSDPSKIIKLSWQPENVQIEVQKNVVNLPKGSFGYFEENFTIPEPLASDSIVTLSMDYLYSLAVGGTELIDLVAFISIDIAGINKNTSTSFIDLVEDSWTKMSINYDLNLAGQELPNNVTIRAGIFAVNETLNTGSKEHYLSIDNIQCIIRTKPNQPNLLIAKDTEFGIEYPYENITYGKGKTFIDVERNRSQTSDIKFTISKNSTVTDELEIYNITITSEAVKIFNSTIDGLDGSIYTTNDQVNWQTECSFSIPYNYLNNWAEINKPTDWNITSILDGYSVEKKESCEGIGLGSTRLLIPEDILAPGLWKITADSLNYISHGSINLWNGTDYIQKSKFAFGDFFQITATLNNTIAYQNTYINCTIQYPNGTLYWKSSKELISHDVTFGDFIVGKNMTIGMYKVMLLWTNNQSYLKCEKVGYSELNFIVWHHTNLTAVDSYIETVSGDPLLIKINFTDYDENTYIDFASITYNSTLPGEISGVMAYLGSGIYVADIDTSSITVGDYYFSFNASKDYFENQSIRNLIQIKIIYQQIAIEVPSAVINANANSYAICNINITGALTHTLIGGRTNISTDWHKPYEIKNGTFEGTYIINFSTYNVPTQGNLETFTIKIFANKSSYGSTSAFISLTVHPIATKANVNETLIDVYFNENFYLEVNYLVEESSDVITGATLNITWPSFYDVELTPIGFIINFSTEGLSIGVYSILIQLDHPGFETALKSVYVNVIPKSTTLEIYLNQVNKTTDRSVSVSWNEPLNITIFYKDSMVNSYIEGATVEVNGSVTSESLYHSTPLYTIIFNPGDLPIGVHFITVTAQKDNYHQISTVIKITVEQIEIMVKTMSFTDTLEIFAGKSINLRINLSEYNTGNIIENANITYSWFFDFHGEFHNEGNGIYEANLKIPERAKGSYTMTLTILTEGGVYETTEFSFIILVSQLPAPNYLILIILIVSLVVTGVFSILLVRTYVIIPRKRKKEKIFTNTIQVFKDVRNIHGIMLLQKQSGIPIF
ncbi:MAG: hypothetical protein ACFFDY_13940, partial [Candidatus Thorarchaeota archaeon]